MAQTLNFTKNGKFWEAEATVTGDYNLHIERVKGGSFNIFQRGTENGEPMVCSGKRC